MGVIKSILSLACVLGTLSVLGQDTRGDYFRSPLDIPLYLAGNFGEMRMDHFHSGLDFKTQGREGLKVYAVADGYVSRIKVSGFGYGNALYITHPNGTTSVYAHLSSYAPPVANFLKDTQYNLQSFEVDLYPDSSQLIVSQGEVIGLSGNTGSSGGPHLHFEIRDTKTEYPLNPLLLGFEVKDFVKPKILNLMVIGRNGLGYWDDAHAKIYACYPDRGACKLSEKLPITVPSNLGFAVEVLDRLNDQPNKCGVYEIRLFVDSEMIFHQRMDKLDFATKRHMNAHIVYPYFVHKKSKFHRSFVLPNNALDIYPKSCSGLQLIEGLHHAFYEVRDAAGNLSTLSFSFVVSESEIPKDCAVHGIWFAYDSVNAFRSSNCTVFIPEGRLFDDMDFSYRLLDSISGALSAVHEVGNADVSLANSYLLKIKTPLVDSTLIGNLTVCFLNGKNEIVRSLGGKFRYGWMECRPKKFGKFAVFLDTIPPQVKSVDFRRDMTSYHDFSFKITDNLSGIEHYRATIDGRWCLMSYRPRKGKITYVFDDEKVKSGHHHFALEVVDERGNVSSFEAEFVR